MLNVFISFANEDVDLLNELVEHLNPLVGQELISIWHQRELRGGDRRDIIVDQQLDKAQIILLLVSPSFRGQEDCRQQVVRAMQKYNNDRGHIRVIPILLRAIIGLTDEPFGKLQILPQSGEPIANARNKAQRGQVFVGVAREIRKVVGELASRPNPPVPITPQNIALPPDSSRSANVPPVLDPLKGRFFGAISGGAPRETPIPEGVLDQGIPDQVGVQLSRIEDLLKDIKSSLVRPTRRDLLVGGLAGLIGAGGASLLTWLLVMPKTPPPTRHFPLTYFGHLSEVNAVAWSPDGKLIASGSRDETVRVWHFTIDDDVLVYAGHRDWVFGVCWSPDGQNIASASADQTVQVWDPTTGHLNFTYKGHVLSVQTVAWSPDGKSIASGSRDRTVQVWDINGNRLQTYNGHRAQVDVVTWSPDSKQIASGGVDKTVQVWDSASGHNLYVYKGHSSEVIAVAWSPDGLRIASGGGDISNPSQGDNTVQVWDPTTGHLFFAYSGHSALVQAVAWSPDGKYLASSGADQKVQVWDATTGVHVYTYHGHFNWVHTLAWSPDGKYIASASADQTIQVWLP